MTFAFKLITPEKIFFSGEATLVTAPGEEGDFGVLAGHSPLISTLKPGVVLVENGASVQKIAVLDGVAEVNETSCTILAEHAQAIDGLSKADAETALADAREVLSDAESEPAKNRARQKVAMAEAIVAVVA